MDHSPTADNDIRGRTRSSQYAYVILTLGTICFATNHVIGRGVHAEIPPVGLSFWRWFTGAIILLPFVWRRLFTSSRVIISHLKPLAFLGCMMIGATTLILVALNYTSAVNVSLVNATQPVFTVLLAWIIFREHLRWSQVAGIVIGLAGVVIMVSRADWHMFANLQFNTGDLVALLAILGFSVYAINIRKIPGDLTAPVALFVIIVSGCLALLPFYFTETMLYKSVPVNVTSILVIVTLALAISVFGMLFWNEGNHIIGPGRAGMFINLIPVFTSIMAITFLHEHLYIYHLGGALLISSGIYLVLRK